MFTIQRIKTLHCTYMPDNTLYASPQLPELNQMMESHASLQVKLRDVPQWEGATRLQLELLSSQLPQRAALRLQAALPVPPLPSAAAPLPPAAADCHTAQLEAAGPVQGRQSAASPGAAGQGGSSSELPSATAAAAADPWVVLEAHEAGRAAAARSGGDRIGDAAAAAAAGPTAAHWLAGAVRRRRTRLTYGAVADAPGGSGE